MRETPHKKIKEILKDKIPLDLIEDIPKKWEIIGEVGIIKLDKKLSSYSKKIGKVYSDVLNCKTILEDTGGIGGEFRKPEVKILYGSTNTETVHIENKIKFKLDPQKIMFSSGNMDERKRTARIPNKGEVIADLFAGIGYFSIPMAVYSNPKKIFACEKNPIAYKYLSENITLNNVNDIVKPVLGDNRKTAPKQVADRVILGYFGNTKDFIQTAIDALKQKQGIIHYHDLFPNESVPKEAIKIIDKIADINNRKVKLLNYRLVKSFAPRIGHYVFDLEIGKI